MQRKPEAAKTDTARKRRGFIPMEGATRKRSIYVLYENGRSVDIASDLRSAKQFMRG
ncbi:hypothetical protein SAMN04488056_12121 [Cohaesibacter marisflavi]|uniref:Uncharacterized protein n=1 Tax=Cohaesibacter marisflavi TaxID=655353 RepID=A0A1I5MFS4_9HYPH|nr:hypothetical protein [Cohaesibacter marisflavi]SFP08363.1 hypothetical protein SAMN04488056_12121 [Cohaesibacter marisflavi]